MEVLADVLHPYPATKIGFQPTNDLQRTEAEEKSQDVDWSGQADLSETSHNISSTFSTASNPDDTSDLIQVDPYPDSELLASSADCLHVWEMERNEDVSDLYDAMSLRPSLSLSLIHI